MVQGGVRCAQFHLASRSVCHYANMTTCPAGAGGLNAATTCQALQLNLQTPIPRHNTPRDDAPALWPPTPRPRVRRPRFPTSLAPRRFSTPGLAGAAKRVAMEVSTAAVPTLAPALHVACLRAAGRPGCASPVAATSGGGTRLDSPPPRPGAPGRWPAPSLAAAPEPGGRQVVGTKVAEAPRHICIHVSWQ